MAHTTIAYLERRYSALEKEIADALRHSATDDQAIDDLKYRRLIIAGEIQHNRDWSSVSASAVLTKHNRQGNAYPLHGLADAAGERDVDERHRLSDVSKRLETSGISSGGNQGRGASWRRPNWSFRHATCRRPPVIWALVADSHLPMTVPCVNLTREEPLIQRVLAQ